MSAASDKSVLLDAATRSPFADSLSADALAALRAALAIVAPYAWSFYAEHAAAVLFSKRVLFFSVKITVADFLPIMVMLFGPKPAAVIV